MLGRDDLVRLAVFALYGEHEGSQQLSRRRIRPSAERADYEAHARASLPLLGSVLSQLDRGTLDNDDDRYYLNGGRGQGCVDRITETVLQSLECERRNRRLDPPLEPPPIVRTCSGYFGTPRVDCGLTPSERRFLVDHVAEMQRVYGCGGVLANSLANANRSAATSTGSSADAQ